MAGVKKKSWKEFQEVGLLWWVNRALHLFGWTLVMEAEEGGRVTNCYPARVSYRGFSAEIEEEGFRKLTQLMAEDSESLLAEVQQTPDA